MLIRTFVVLALLLISSVGLTACGGAPVSIAAVPVPPDATPLAAGTNTLADSVADSVRQSMSTQSSTVDLQLYTLPDSADWAQLTSFYEHELAGDWSSEAQLAQDTEAFKSLGWTRGMLASEQGLVVGYGPALFDQPPFMLVALISE